MTLKNGWNTNYHFAPPNPLRFPLGILAIHCGTEKGKVKVRSPGNIHYGIEKGGGVIVISIEGLLSRQPSSPVFYLPLSTINY